jgi:hypothetical protein
MMQLTVILLIFNLTLTHSFKKFESFRKQNNKLYLDKKNNINNDINEILAIKVLKKTVFSSIIGLSLLSSSVLAVEQTVSSTTSTSSTSNNVEIKKIPLYNKRSTDLVFITLNLLLLLIYFILFFRLFVFPLSMLIALNSFFLF